MKKYLYLLFLLGLGFTNSHAQVQIGNGTNTSQRIPFEPFYVYTYAQMIYLQNEISASGNITSLDFYWDGTTLLPNSQNLTIYMGHSTKTAFAGTTDWESFSNLTQVYQGGIDVSGGVGWITLTLNNAFNYNNTDNLIIAFKEDAAGYDSSSDNFHCTDVGTLRSLCYYSDSTNPNPNSPPTANYSGNYIPNVILGGIQQACPAPTGLASGATTGTTAELSWNENGVSTDWDVEIINISLGETASGNPTDTNVSNPYLATGLAAGSDYAFYVRSGCGTESSGWAGPFYFITDRVVTCGTPLPQTYCYDNNDSQTFLYAASDGASNLILTFNAGGIESCCDDIIIYDGVDNTAPVLYNGNNSGNLAGISVSSTGPNLFMALDMDGSVSCASGSTCCTAEWDWDVNCLNCMQPQATVTVNEDCTNGFTLDVNVSSLGDAATIDILNGTNVLASDVGTGVTTLGPFINGTAVNLILAHDSDPVCNVNLGNFVNATICPIAATVLCGSAPLSQNYCYENNDPTTWNYTTSNSTGTLTVSFSQGYLESCCDALIIYDGIDATAPQLYNSNGASTLAGVTVSSTGPNIFMDISSDGSVSCSSGSGVAWDFEVECIGGCDLPQGTANYDCSTGELVVAISNIGGPEGGPYDLSIEGESNPTQAVASTGDYIFTGLTANENYNIVAIDGNGCGGIVTTIFTDCPCEAPIGTANYDCFTNQLTVSISDVGGPNGGAYELSVSDGVPTQTIVSAGDYVFAGLAANTNYTVTATNIGGCTETLATLFADCACLSPVGTATYDCNGDFINLNITNPGLPVGSYSASIDGSGASQNISASGDYTFGGLTADQTYNVIFDDGLGCTDSIKYVYGGCTTPGPQCSNIISNGDFENGSGIWTQTAEGVLGGGSIVVYDNNEPHINTQFSIAGTQSALLGRYGGFSPPVAGTLPPYTSIISKTVFTTDNHELNASFWVYWETCDSPNDMLTLRVEGVDQVTFMGGAFCGDDKWHQLSVDLSAFSDGTSALLEWVLVENETNGGPTRVYIDEIFVESCPPEITCPASYPTLAGSPMPGSPQEVAPNMYDYETDGNILSIQTIQAGQTVDYDSGTEITLGIPGIGFEVQLGAVFSAFIDGCNGTGGEVNPLGETESESTNALSKEEEEDKPQKKDKE